MRRLNTTTFFAYIRNLPFGGTLSQEQVDGTTAILDACAAADVADTRHVAYILATAFHETGGKMIAVREGFSKSDAAARKKLAKYPYSKPDPVTGHSYYGRGHVQLTHADNYKRMGEIIGVDLYNNPDLALDPKLSARILVEGMIKGKSGRGDFTKYSVENYFNGAVTDPVGARKIVNGTDKAHLIEKYYIAFLDALDAAQAPVMPADVTVKAGEADKPNLLTDKTLLGGVSAVASSGVFGMFTAIDSPYALGALVVLIIAAGVFWYGRQRIIKKAGV